MILLSFNMSIFKSPKLDSQLFVHKSMCSEVCAQIENLFLSYLYQLLKNKPNHTYHHIPLYEYTSAPHPEQREREKDTVESLKLPLNSQSPSNPVKLRR